MKSKGITRCMMLALLMVFMTAGAAFAGVGGSDVPTVTSPVIVGDTGLSQSFTITNQSTNPNQVNPVILSGIYYVTTCGSALTPAVGCLVGDQEAPNTITVFPLTTPIGVAGACTGVSFTAAPTASPNEYSFTPATPVILGPSDGSGASPLCEVQFTVDVNTMPVNDALGAAGLQTAQLARATMTDTTTAETGFAAGSSTVTVGETCLHVEKNCTSPTACEGAISVSVTAANCGDADLTNLVVTDDHAGTLTCGQTTLAVGASTTCTGSYTNTPGTYTNTITASADDPNGNLVTPDGPSILNDTCTIIPCPDVNLAKVCEDSTSCEDTSIEFTITVSNPGPVPLNQCTINDPDCLGTQTTGLIAVGGSASYTCSKTGSPGGSVSNTADVSCTSPNGDVATATASDTCSIPECPDVNLTKVCEDSTSCEDTSIEFTITVSNPGPVNLTECTITDPDCLGTQTTGLIAVGGSASYTCSKTGSAGGSVSNTADVSCTSPDGDVATATASDTCSIPECPGVNLTKECEDSTSCEDTSIEFTITVSNPGPVDLTECTITDPDCLGTQTTGLIVVGGSASYTCSKTGSAGGSVSNTADVSCTSPDGDVVTATASDTCSIPECPDVNLTKVCEDSTSCTDTEIEFTITVSNPGPVDLTECTITDPDCLGTQTTGLIAVGGSASYTCSKTGSPGGSVSNTADVSCTSPDGDVATATASDTCSIPECPCQIDITKAVALDDDCDGIPDGPFVESVTQDGGECVVYEICVTNTLTNGAQELVNVQVSDTHLGILNFTVGSLAPGATECFLVASEISAEACAGNICICENVAGTNTAVASADCAETMDNACLQPGSNCDDTAMVDCVAGCRMTGGHVAMARVDSTFDDPESGTVYTTGGQIGAPTDFGCCNEPPTNRGRNSECPWGDWEHNHHSGPDDTGSVLDGKFAFHSGTAAAPDEAFIKSIICADNGWCVQARPAPNKQIFWEGWGVFHNIKGEKGSVLPVFAACADQPTVWDKKTGGTLHYYRAHVGDFGEPAGIRQKPIEDCPWTNECPDGGGISIADCALVDGFCPLEPAPQNDKFTGLHPLCIAQDCVECPDWYEIEIHCTADPASLVAYRVAHHITQGNFQIHPPVGASCNPELTCAGPDGPFCPYPEAQPPCGTNPGECSSLRTADGSCFCHESIICSDPNVIPCSTDADCLPGWACSHSCCGDEELMCHPPCDDIPNIADIMMDKTPISAPTSSGL